MTASDGAWSPTIAGAVAVGDQIRIRDVELTVSHIEHGFLGDPDRLAFIEDTDDRWLKVPAAPDAAVEVRRAG